MKQGRNATGPKDSRVAIVVIRFFLCKREDGYETDTFIMLHLLQYLFRFFLLSNRCIAMIAFISGFRMITFDPQNLQLTNACTASDGSGY